MLKKIYPIFGLLAPIFYLSAVIAGGLIIPGYSHTYNTISEITAANQPFRPGLTSLFLGYNLMLFFFAVGGLLFFKLRRQTLTRIVFTLLILSALLGAALLIFPQDARDMPMTLAGRIHIILAGITAPATIACTVLLGLAAKNEPGFSQFSIFSMIMGAFILATGGLTAASIAQDSPFGGLFERMTIGAFILWVFATALTILSSRSSAD
jgi:hypothetical membrane protein